MRHVSVLVLFLGLTFVWAGTALLISPAAARLFDNPANLPMAFAGQALLWVLAAAVVASVLFWEKKPLVSLWLKPFCWQSIAWGLALVAINYAVIVPIGEGLRAATGLSGFEQGMDRVMRFPISYRITAFITAGVVEELLFRGYTITRLTMLTGNVWLAGAVAMAGFAALHVPYWGWGFAIISLIGGTLATVFFIWRKDLLSMMVFHASTDALGLVIAPMFSEWWRAPRV